MIKKYLLPLILTIFISFIVFFCFDIVYDDSYDGLVSNITSAQFSDFSLLDWHYLGLIGIKDVIYILQDEFPSINIHATFNLLSNILSLLYTLIAINTLILKKQNSILKTIILLSVSILFIENIVSVQHTRFATIFSGVAMIYLLFGNQNLKLILLHSLIFLFGFLTRSESAIGMFLIVSVGFVLYKFNFNRYIKGAFIPASIILITIIIFSIHKSHTKRFEILIEPDIEYALSTGRVIPLSEMQNEADSLRYKMARWGVFIDTSFVNIEFLESITTNQFKIEINQLIDSIGNVIYFYSYYTVFLFLFFIFSYVIIKHFKNYKTLLQLIIFNFFIFILLVYLDYNVDIADRHFIVMLTIATLVSMIYSFKNRLFIYKMNFTESSMCILLIILSSGNTLYNALGNQVLVAQEVECIQKSMQDIDQTYNKEIIAATLTTYRLLDQKYTFYNKNYANNTYIMYDLSTYSIVPRYTAYLSKLCNCDASDAFSFLKWASRNEVIFIVTEERAKLIKEYLQLRHNTIVKFLDPPNINDIIKHDCMFNTVYYNYKLTLIKFDS